MKWTDDNKRTICRLLEDKWRSCGVLSREWETFLDSLGIKEVHRDDSRLWMREGDTPNFFEIPAVSNERIIVKDPNFWRPRGAYLSIPKDVAEKFLVLGVP